jgi:hypothetical protein
VPPNAIVLKASPALNLAGASLLPSMVR